MTDMIITPDNRVFIGIGSNLGNGPANCIESIQKIVSDERVTFGAVSSLYVTSPVSSVQQENYYNCALCINWNESPFKLLEFLNHIENSIGRKRDTPHGPRIIDLDILLFGTIILNHPILTIPHPALHKRRFAIVPCLEIDPAIVHPLFRKPLEEFLKNIDSSQKVEYSRQITVNVQLTNVCHRQDN